MFLGELLDAPFKGRVLGERGLDGVAGDHLLGVAELAHQLADSLPLGEHLLLRAAEFSFGVERAFAPRRLDPLVGPDRCPVAAGLAVGGGLLDQRSGVRVLVEERGGHPGPVGDGSDGEPAAFAEFEREMIIDRVVNGMERKAGKGQWTLGVAPVGSPMT